MSSRLPEFQETTSTTTGFAPDAPPEMASVLFMDIVGYSLEPMERQSALLQKLQTIARATPEFQRAQEAGRLISLPTGDGFALVFFDLPMVAVECGLKVCKALKERPEIKLRMGVHTGPVYRIDDINANINVAGGGINMAQRVMDCGDAGHLLISSTVADVLSHLEGWAKNLKDLGDYRAKNGVRIHIYAICTEDVANHEIPAKLRAQAPATSGGQVSRRVWIGGGVAVLAGVAAFGAFRSGLLAPKPVATPAARRTLAYWVLVQKFRAGKPFESPFRLAQDINFEANYGIQLGFSSPQAGYLYILNEGPELKNGVPDYHVLFPSPHMNDGSPRLIANAETHIPPDNQNFIRFDDQEGTEKLWIVWAKDEPPVLAAALKAASFAPEDGGSIKHSTLVAELAGFLKARSENPPRVVQDEAGQRTEITADEDVLVFRRRLEHH
ncbi:MAG: adenylate/guanylate cyclase domain-containing protein [Bryobacteraceae bacterium]|nr:adenylate/guanylate cyclase domain-containing protein [Bryobacteraceae bacterium]